MAPRKLLKSPLDVPGYDMEPLVVASLAEFSGEKVKPRFEFAGRAFHVWQRRVCLGIDDVEEEKRKKRNDAREQARGGSEEEEESGDSEEDAVRRREYEKRKAERSAKGDYDWEDEEDEDVNYYELLGIGHIGLNASDKQIKKAYQAAVLKSHPDKIAANLTDKGEIAKVNEAFGKIQKAYEVLSNPVLRRGYDSNFKFDDAIPTGMEKLDSEAAFFKLYGPVFESNARFSEVKPVPMLGGPDDSVESVRAFYAFWRGFKSWRDFSKFDEFKQNDLETAECRDERRWMMRKNEAERERRKKKEYARVSALVERAYANDPRVAKAKMQMERAKQEAKQQREEAARRRAQEAQEAEEAARRREAEAKEEETRKREEEKRAKAESKARAKRAVKRIRELVSTRGGEEGRRLLESSETEAYFTASTAEPSALEALAEEMEKLGESSSSETEIIKPLARVVGEASEERKRAEREKQERAEAVRQAGEEDRKAAKKQAMMVWTPEMVSALSKGLAKHPGGTRNRWMVISNYMTTCGFTVSAEECANYANNVAKSSLAPAASSGLKGVPAFIPPKVEIVDKEAAAPAGVAPLLKAVTTTAATTTTSTSATGTKAGGGAEGETSSKPWTPEEIKLLQAAILEFPATMEKNERWSAIAGRVPGRTKKECAAKFNALREKALAAGGNGSKGGGV